MDKTHLIKRTKPTFEVAKVIEVIHRTLYNFNNRGGIMKKNLEEINERKEIREARNELVVKHNDLLRKSRYTLSANEQKIIIYLISKINADDKELKEIEINILDFCKVIGIEINGDAYNRVKETIKSLADKSWWLTFTEKKETLFRWINEAEIEKGNGTIKLQLSNHLKPYLLELKKNFTKYELINILSLRSKYSIRLYELLKSYLWQGGWQVSVKEIRELLETEGKYKEFKDFRKRVLNPAIEEINGYTDLQIEISTLKRGKSISHLHFKIDEKTGYQMTIDMIMNRNERLK